MPYFAEGASIVNISSSRNRMSQPETESYTAAKGGIHALTHALAVSLAGKVRVNSISPGWIDTDYRIFGYMKELMRFSSLPVGWGIHWILQIWFYTCVRIRPALLPVRTSALTEV